MEPEGYEAVTTIHKWHKVLVRDNLLVNDSCNFAVAPRHTH